MNLKKCTCGRIAEMVKDEQGFEVECPRCGKRTGHFHYEIEAWFEWNRTKMIEVEVEGDDSVIIN